MRFVIALLIVAMPSLASAHAGHDHSHWSSHMIHLGLALAVVLAVALGLFVSERRSKLKFMLGRGKH